MHRHLDKYFPKPISDLIYGKTLEKKYPFLKIEIFDKRYHFIYKGFSHFNINNSTYFTGIPKSFLRSVISGLKNNENIDECINSSPDDVHLIRFNQETMRYSHTCTGMYRLPIEVSDIITKNDVKNIIREFEKIK